MDISPDVERHLGFYVYAYIDPRDKSVFYVGKGVGSRAIAHLNEESESQKVLRILEIRESGSEPRIDIIARGLRDDREATRVEAALIELIGITNLTNIVRGHQSTDFPRRELRHIIHECAARPVEVVHPSVLIRINRSFEYEGSADQLYEATRGVWVIGPRRAMVKFAMAVYAGVIREVYEIESWHPAGSTPYKTRDQNALANNKTNRWEFVGKPADEQLRKQYIGGSVANGFRPGQQSPVMIVGVKV